MKSLTRITVIGLAVVAGLALVYLFLLITEPDSDSTGRIVFISGEPTDVQSVTVRNAYGEFSFFYDFDEDGYVLDDIPPYIADIEVFFDFMANAANISAVRQISSSDTVHQDLGLSEPSAEVEILLFDRSFLHLKIGGVERISGNFYASVGGFDGVYIIPRTVGQQFQLPKTQIISRLVTPPLAVSSPLSAIRDITFNGGSLQHPVTILITTGGNESTRLAAMSFGAATHIMHGAGVYQLDQTYGVHILGSLFEIEAVQVVGYDLSREEVAAFGFDTPYMSIDYDMINGVDADLRHMRLRIVEADDGLYYATLEDSSIVYLIRREAFLDIEYERLPVRWFLTPLIMDLSAVIVSTSDKQFRFEIDNTDPLDPTITYNSQTIDNTLFRSFFRLLTSAAHDDVYLGLLPSPSPGSQPLIRITYEYSDPGKAPDLLALYRGEARRANVFINGVGEFAMKDLFAERVLEGCVNLIAGSPIEENW